MVPNPFEHRQIHPGQVFHGPLRRLDGNGGIVGSPDEPNRLRNPVEFRLVTLIDHRNEDVADDAARAR